MLVYLDLGDNEVGKTTLMGKLAGTVTDESKKGSGLEYHHLLIKDDYTEDTTRLGVWVRIKKKCLYANLCQIHDGEIIGDHTINELQEKILRSAL